VVVSQFLGAINRELTRRDFPEADFWPGITSC